MKTLLVISLIIAALIVKNKNFLFNNDEPKINSCSLNKYDYVEPLIEEPIDETGETCSEVNEIRSALLKGVKHFEGFYSHRYYCSGNTLTIGYGHTGKGTRNKTISKKTAETLLLQDLNKVEQSVSKYVKVPLTEGQRACLISFTFNCGEGALNKLVNGKSRLNSGNYSSVKHLLPKYRMADGKVLRGLEKRRAWELALWEKNKTKESFVANK